MLRIHFLNVEHGDAIVLEDENQGQRHFAVIDSNMKGDGDPPVLQKLRQLGADRLSFVLLTHPHRDHYRGLEKVLQAYDGRIGTFFIFPLGEFIPSRIRNLSRQYIEIAKRQDDDEVSRAAEELVAILIFLYKNMKENVIQCAGEQVNLLPPEGFNETEIFTIAPPNRAKGHYFQQIATGDPKIVEDVKQNDLSVGVLIRVGSAEIVLGGDVPFDNWQFHRRRNRHSDEAINASIVKIPHHGSKHDASRMVLQYLFSTTGERVAVISANGHSHPSEEVIHNLEAMGIHPYCTNLIPQCGANVQQLINTRGVDPELGKFVNFFQGGLSKVQPCQGSVTLTIRPGMPIIIDREFQHPCGFRGDFARLFA
jgi:beta-lactamase superfamily II metal-dependent hydrolase